MKRSTAMGFIALTIFLSTACKKKKHTTNDPDPETAVQTPVQTPAESSSGYSQLKTGNYWIYQSFEVSPDGSTKPLNEFDSCYVEKDTTVGNYVYSKLRKRNPLNNTLSVSLQRDSLHYIITPQGIIFSSDDFTSTFGRYYSIMPVGDTLSGVTAKMADKDFKIMTPAGTFITSAMRTTITTWPAHEIPGAINPRHLNTRYAKNVGVISETIMYFSGDPKVIERRLVRYHLN